MTERQHHPLCESSGPGALGPDFVVTPDTVTIIITPCIGFACWDTGPDQHRQGARGSGSQAAAVARPLETPLDHVRRNRRGDG